VELNNHQKKNVDYLLGILDKEPFIPQKINDVANSEELKELIFISPNDYFVNLDNEFVLSKKAFLKLEQKIIDYINKNEKLSLADYRDITNSSRRYAMIVLEKMDSLNITARKENYRVLGDKANVF
ncbi:SelB domain-containing protein, partial [Ligilactobacillus salivarius]